LLTLKPSGKWVDFVMHVKWTGDSDGFLKLWVKEGDKSYNLRLMKNADILG